MKDKQWKDYWDIDLGVSYIPISKLDPQVRVCLLYLKHYRISYVVFILVLINLQLKGQGHEIWIE